LSHEYVAVGESGPTSSKQTLLLLHGLLGNKKNLRSFAKLIAREFPEDWQVLLMDLRGHGATPKLNEGMQEESGELPPALYLAAEDIAYTCDAIGAPPPVIVCGHSMGGKVSLAYLHSCLRGQFNGNQSYFALHGSRCAPFSTWTLDSVPVAVNRGEEEAANDNDDPEARQKESVASVLTAVSRVSATAAAEHPPKTIMQSKGNLVAALRAQGCSAETAAWMTTNVEKADGDGKGNKLQFVFHVPTCEALYESYADLDFLPLVSRIAARGTATTTGEAAGETTIGGGGVVVSVGAEVDVPPMCSLDMVRAGRNTASWPSSVVARLEAACSEGPSNDDDGGGSRLHLLPGSGHNVHIDDPAGLLALMRPTLERLA
jgi:pimeloyl-ACP methyl ester carboxylesterase